MDLLGKKILNSAFKQPRCTFPSSPIYSKYLKHLFLLRFYQLKNWIYSTHFLVFLVEKEKQLSFQRPPQQLLKEDILPKNSSGGRRIDFPEFFSDKNKAAHFTRLLQQTNRVPMFLSLFLLPHITATSQSCIVTEQFSQGPYVNKICRYRAWILGGHR